MLGHKQDHCRENGFVWLYCMHRMYFCIFTSYKISLDDAMVEGVERQPLNFDAMRSNISRHRCLCFVLL